MTTTAQPKTGITYADFLAMPRTTQPHEILDGVLCVYKTPSVEQQWLVMNLLRGLHAPTRPGRRGVVLPGPLDVFIRKEPRLRTRQPDILYYSAERTGIRGRKELQEHPVMDAAPDLVVEFLSPNERRRTLAGKLADYAEIGVREVWLVSPEAETVEALALSEGGYKRSGLFGIGDTIDSPVLPDLDLTVDAIFED